MQRAHVLAFEEYQFNGLLVGLVPRLKNSWDDS